MFTSDKPISGKQYTAVAGGYLLSAAGCAVFGAVYELFSHGVCSCFMICAFAFPLLLGAVPFFLLRKHGKPFPGKAAGLVHAGVAALTVGSVVQGILAIYGTTNPLTAVYWITGAGLTAAGWSLILKTAACKKPSSPASRGSSPVL